MEGLKLWSKSVTDEDKFSLISKIERELLKVVTSNMSANEDCLNDELAGEIIFNCLIGFSSEILIRIILAGKISDPKEFLSYYGTSTVKEVLEFMAGNKCKNKVMH